MKRIDIFELIIKERERQDKKWGNMPKHLSDVIWFTILLEEVGEVAQDILKQNWQHIKIELIQVLAVGVSWLEDEENHDNGLYKVG